MMMRGGPGGPRGGMRGRGGRGMLPRGGPMMGRGGGSQMMGGVGGRPPMRWAFAVVLVYGVAIYSFSFWEYPVLLLCIAFCVAC